MTDDMIRSGQHTGLANQIVEGKVTYVIIFIGANDFQMWSGGYDEIYNGKLSGASLDAKLDRIVNNLTVAVDTLVAAGSARMLLINIPDVSLDADIIASHPEPEKRRRVTAAISSVNRRLAVLAEERKIPLLDMEAYAKDFLTRVEAHNQLLIGSTAINVRTKGNNPRFLRLDDPVGHAGTVSMSLFANEFVIDPLREHYGVCIEPFTDQEILEIAGIASAQ